VRRLSVLGVPSSAGSYAAGQEQAPAALRAAGLIEKLGSTGWEVSDHGDLPRQTWHPDRSNPRAQNADQVVTCIQQLIERLEPLVATDDTLLVLGGNCTIVLGVVAALRDISDEPTGLVYVDRGFDINTPASTTDGALDWMGMAHALALPGAIEPLIDVLGYRPLLEPAQIFWLGVDSRMATEWERGQAERLDLRVFSSTELASNPVRVAELALRSLPPGPLAVHFDVDVLDFTDAPLAENTDGRNTGPTLDQAADALAVAVRDRRFRALSIGELNPTRSAGDPAAIDRFVDVLCRVLAGQGSPAVPTVDWPS
jgi:arginase